MLEAKDAPAGKMDVVMQNGWGGVLVHEAVGHPLEADNIARQIGAFTGKLGQKVASPIFTMVDDGTLPNAPRDDELRRRGHADAAQRAHQGRRAADVHDRRPVGQPAQAEAHRQRPARELPLPADSRA